MKPKKLNSVFISDVHLGLRKSKRKELISFLDSIDAEHYFFIGDIIDLWKLKSGFSWRNDDNEVLRKILKLAKTRHVVFVPGNHDELFRDFCGHEFLGIQIRHEFIHVTKNDVKILLVHGDIFDKIILHNKWLGILGSWMYDVLLELNEVNLWIRNKFGLKPWSLSMYLKHKAKEATGLMENFKSAAIEYAAKHDCDMIITGHIHRPELTPLYGNCGDWVENCSAVVEHLDGRLEIFQK